MTFLTFLALLAASTALGFMCLYFSAGSYRGEMFSYYMTQPKLIVLNTLPFVLLAMLVWFLSNRAWLGFLTSGLVCLFYSWAEYWTLLSRSEPIYAEEVVLISEAAQMGTHYITLTFRIWLSLGLVVFGTLFFLAFLRGRMPHWSLRAVLPLLVIAGSWLLYQNVYLNTDLYNSFRVKPGLNKYMDSTRYISRGGMYPFLYSTRNLRITEPDGYSTDKALAILENFDTDPIPEDKKVSVICIMFEAFSDLSAYSDRIPEEPYAPFHALQDESYTGQLVTNIFAGGTVDTERDVITGYNTVAAYRRPAWSYARYFEANGYSLNGSHPSNSSFYSRSTVNRALGFPDYLFLENHYEAISGGISPDSDLLPEITRLCKEDMAAGKPVFSFNVTYQNHGPYNAKKLNVLKKQEYIAQGDLGTEAYYIVNNYLNGIADTAQRMMDMADAFRDSSEPVILVFFGDHKPWMGDQGSVYPLLDIDFASEGDQSFYNYHSTEYLIWANQTAKETLGNDFLGEGPMISPCYLMNVLFDLCGWEGPSYQKLTDQVMAQLPVVSLKKRYLENGALTDPEGLTAQGRELLDQLFYAQFYLARESDGQLPN